MLVCFHDYTSPASAVAVRRLQRLADEGLPVAFEGIDVLGVEVSLPVTLDVLAQLDQHRSAAADLGLRLRRPDVQPPTLAAHVVGDVAERLGLGAAWRSVAYRAYWEDARDIADHAVLAELAGAAGLPDGAAEAALGDTRLRLDVRRRMGARRSEGVGGVPVLLAGRTFVPALLPEAELRTLAGIG
ncbi:MAG: DsbA family protein [Actinobacteria bacterium]|nr:DsbA family protein [Actinomycetota bacterium]